MHSVKEKVSNAASAAKAHVESYKANVEEKAEKATARTHEEKEIAHQRRKAKEAEGNMNLHDEKAQHAAEKLHGKHHVLGHHQQPFGAMDPITGTTAPTFPLGGHLHGHKHH
ncbi:putative Late embryogenesis abundant protein, LEA_1 subgroup [Helianthus annuus]|uniref:Late embryogenesis abundant protein, LEA_1 subgroup n=1 Tax=Helianthus annuus TaxID=4232 RepID=A0A251VF81_HELAN|nr:late embryogenesis abundant protein 6 [Helianthus annuus]KAF5774609.1 putative Late embryogenesis abundant protein, LEA_1 subgroup [Helianthus annuus]KAJ0850420.1 putative Late embryogenesis abundant protein, LEA_1 subgroup [Helianthus annuus]KAJ0859459.1 putative Late embryogenesis abundant protein, LEA_1 subgroup [Helianthus annuus]